MPDPGDGDLAGGADRDVSDVKTLLRAHTQTLTALRETQLEQHEEIRAIRLEQQQEIRVLRSEMQRGFGMLQTGIAQIIATLPDHNDEDDPS